jgi:hypothetical protein
LRSKQQIEKNSIRRFRQITNLVLGLTKRDISETKPVTSMITLSFNFSNPSLSLLQERSVKWKTPDKPNKHLLSLQLAANLVSDAFEFALDLISNAFEFALELVGNSFELAAKLFVFFLKKTHQERNEKQKTFSFCKTDSSENDHKSTFYCLRGLQSSIVKSVTQKKKSH